MKCRLRQLALLVCSAFVVACASESAAKLERVEPAPQLAVRPRLLLHASDDVNERLELGRTFGRFLREATDAELAPLATCDVECATSKSLAKLGVDPKGVRIVLLEPGEPAVVLIRGRIPPPGGAGAPSVLAPNDGKPVSVRERLARRSRVSTEFLARQLALALGPGSPAAERGCARELAVFDEAMTGTGAFDDGTPFNWRAECAPFHLVLQAAHDAGASKSLAEYTRERWYRGAPKGSRWEDTLAQPACVEDPNTAGGCYHCLHFQEPDRFGDELRLLSEAELENQRLQVK